MNVYTVGFYQSNLNGYSTFPVSYKSNPARDGVVMLFTTLPGGSSPERQGSTLVHEAGHWLGLRHTFENGCETPGDGVDDTAPEAEAARGCPIGRISCPGSGLPDPIRQCSSFFVIPRIVLILLSQITSWIIPMKAAEQNSHLVKSTLSKDRFSPTVAALTHKLCCVI